MPELNPDQFFHGTTHAIKDGVVRPAWDLGRDAGEYSLGDPGEMSEGDHAFAIKNDEQYAWHAANTFHPSARRSRVYEVDPATDMVPGPHNQHHKDFLENHDLDFPDVSQEEIHEQSQDEWGSKTGFPVRKRIDIMPGRQGTFPDISWGRFSTIPHNQGVNHPSDYEVKYGMFGQQGAVNANQEHATMINENQFGHDWHRDPPPHSILRETAGRPQKRWATLFDTD